jgi:hypothetical protein
MAKKAAKRAAKKTSSRSPQKRDLVKGRSRSYAKRTAKGQFKEMDDVGRSQASDRRKKAKRKVKRGYGDRGDQE